MARGEFTRDSAPPSPRPHSHSLQLLWQVSRSRRRANTDGKVMSYEQEDRVAAGARWSRASRPRPRPSSSACSCSPCSPSSPSGCCHTAWPVDAQQGRSLDEFILYDWDLLRTLGAGALNETDYYARVLCVCVSLTVTLQSVLEWCAYEYKGTGSRCSYGGFECWVTFRGPIVSTRRP